MGQNKNGDCDPHIVPVEFGNVCNYSFFFTFFFTFFFLLLLNITFELMVSILF